MKRLLLLRHGKSDWSVPGQADFDRPINARGQRAARVMGRFLQLAGQVPDRVVCSSAVRARTTLDTAMTAGQWDCEVRVTDNLYASHAERVLEEVRRESGETRALLLVGHEPTWSEMVELLCFGASVRFPTAAMARIDLQLESWRTVRPNTGRLAWMVPPKLFTKGRFDFTI